MNRSEPITVTPRIYRESSPTLGIIYWGCAFLMLTGDWWPVIFNGKTPKWSDYIFRGLYMVIAGMFTFAAFRTFVRLSTDSIEVRRVWGYKVLSFTKIKGRRRYTEKADPYSTPPRHLVLEPNDPSFPRIDIKLRGRDIFDESFYSWFDSLPDLDKLDGIEPLRSKYANFSLV